MNPKETANDIEIKRNNKFIAFYNRINNKLTKWYDKTVKKHVLLRATLKVLGSLALAILIALSIDMINQNTQNVQKKEFDEKVINNLCIGTNEEYVNSVLGPPFLKNKNEVTNMTDCFYKTDEAIVRLFYENNSAKGIFITITKKSAIGRFMFEKYSLTEKKKLGTFTFEETEAGNSGNYFLYSSLGTTFYIEAYSLGRVFSDYDHYFAILPYGTFLVPNETSNNEAEHCHWEAGQMGGYFPNTVGLTDQEYMEKICAMLIDIDRFDYRSMNIFEEEMWDYYDSFPEVEEETEEEDINIVKEPTDFEVSLEEYLHDVYYKDYYGEINGNDES